MYRVGAVSLQSTGFLALCVGDCCRAMPVHLKCEDVTEITDPENYCCAYTVTERG